MTLREWIPQWMQGYKFGTVKERSYHQLELLARRFPDNLLDMELDTIKPMHLQSFFNAFSQDVSKSYMDKMRGMIRGLFSDAFDNDLVPRDPAVKLRALHVIEKPRQSFTEDEAQKILTFVMSHPRQRIGVAVAVMLTTGIRRGELLGIKWDDVDLNGRQLTIRRGVYQEGSKAKVEDFKAKTASSLRDVPLLPEAAYLIQTLPRYGEFVFGTCKGTLWYPRNFSRDYRKFFKAMQDEGLGVRYLPPHCCRHSFATILQATGANTRAAQTILGHSNINTTARYTHPDMNTMQRAVSQMRDGLFPPAADTSKKS